jgi:hypothetical protein
VVYFPIFLSSYESGKIQTFDHRNMSQVFFHRLTPLAYKTHIGVGYYCTVSYRFLILTKIAIYLPKMKSNKTSRKKLDALHVVPLH